MSAETVTKKKGRPKKAIEPEAIVILNSDAADIVETPIKPKRQTTPIKGKSAVAPTAKRDLKKKLKAEKDDAEVEKSKTVSSRKSAKNVRSATPTGTSKIDVDASSTAGSVQVVTISKQDLLPVDVAKPAEEQSKSADTVHNRQPGDELLEGLTENQPLTAAAKPSIDQQQTVIDEPTLDKESIVDVADPSTATGSSSEAIGTVSAESNFTIYTAEKQQQIENLEATFLRGVSELQVVNEDFKALSSRIKNSILFQSLQEKAGLLAHDRVELATSINDLRLSRVASELAGLERHFQELTTHDNILEAEQVQSDVPASKNTSVEAPQHAQSIPLTTAAIHDTSTTIPQVIRTMPPSSRPMPPPSTSQISSFSSSSSSQAKEPPSSTTRPRPSTLAPAPPQSRLPPSQPLPPLPKRPTEQTLQELKKNSDFRRLKYSWTGLIVGIPLVIVLGRYLFNDLQQKQKERRQTTAITDGTDQSPINNIGVDSKRHGGVTSNGGV